MSEECRELIEVAEGPTVCVPAENVSEHPRAVLQDSAYGFKVHIDIPYDQALPAMKRSLSEQGLETIMEIDVQEMLGKRLDIQFRPYTILGVSDPDILRRMLDLDIDSGLLIPCNVVVYEYTSGTVVEAMDTIDHFAISRRRELQDPARELKMKLMDAVDHVAAGVVE